ncbi:MAG: DegV family EDD domain-containing protein [Clostridia bacterium]|nr:DegV family EDD domain-containing protein [Clostridia bacterium]
MKNTHPYFSVDTLEYLKRGGRIGKIAALAGTALGIKPIISFDRVTGELSSTHKVRGRQAAMKKLVQVAISHIDPSKRYNIMWAHGGAPEDGQRIAEMLRAAAPDFVQEFSGEIDCTLASYVGPHLLGAAVQVLDDDM